MKWKILICGKRSVEMMGCMKSRKMKFRVKMSMMRGCIVG